MTTIGDIVQFLSLEAAAVALPPPHSSKTTPDNIDPGLIETIDEKNVKLIKFNVLPKLIKPITRTEQHDFLKAYEVVVLIDQDLGKKSCFKVRQCLPHIIKAAFRYETQGATVGLYFDHSVTWYSKVKPEMTNSLLSLIGPPRAGSSSLDGAIQDAFRIHFQKKHQNEDQKTLILVLTDKTPTDEKAVNDQLIHHVKKIHTEDIGLYEGNRKCLELGLRFFRLTDHPSVKKYFNELPDRLDNELKVSLISTGIYSELSSKEGAREAFVNTIFN